MSYIQAFCMAFAMSVLFGVVTYLSGEDAGYQRGYYDGLAAGRKDGCLGRRA